jgi:lysophospholipase L1-like esterase
VDVAADPRFSDWTDRTYYLDDGVHLNEPAYRIIAEQVVTAILGLHS